MKTLYLDCNSGISGDMTVAALLDIGGDKEKLEQIISEMNISCKLKFGRTSKNGISAYDFDVILPDEHHEHHDHHHEHRGINDILPIIDNSSLPEAAKELSKKMFYIVAEAESKVHGLPVEEVHFHEVGAVDSIVDICATAFLITDLGIEKVIASEISEGTGTINCQHGVIPVPVPATLEIAKTHSLKLKLTDTQGEMITPTGAAIVASLVSEFRKPKNAVIEKIGYGAGKKDFEHANVLRAVLLEENQNNTHYTDDVIVLETNIDDSTAEELGYCLKELFEVGVKDAFFTPIYMKKARPAYSLTVICKEEVEDEAIKIIFKHTTSVGLRRAVKERVIMDREKIQVDTKYGLVEANRFTYEDISKVCLEYSSVKELAKKKDVSIASIYRNY